MQETDEKTEKAQSEEIVDSENNLHKLEPFKLPIIIAIVLSTFVYMPLGLFVTLGALVVFTRLENTVYSFLAWAAFLISLMILLGLGLEYGLFFSPSSVY